MSAMLTLADGEMEVLRKAVRELISVADSDWGSLTPVERHLLERADEKLRKGLARPGRRRPRQRLELTPAMIELAAS